MVNKWTVYIATYTTYSAIHSIRTCFASLKTMLNDQPFYFSEKFLGSMDMFVLLAIALLLYIFGSKVEKYPRRKILFPMMIGLIINLAILFIFLIKEIRSQALYFIFYGTIGVLSALSWPVCLYTTSQYFDSKDAMALSMYSSVSQCGDFLAFLISLLVITAQNGNGAYSMLIMAIVFVMITGYDYFFFRDKSQQAQRPSIVNQVQSAQQQVKNDIDANLQGNMENINQHQVQNQQNNKNQDPIQSEIQENPQKHQKTVSKNAPKSEEALHQNDQAGQDGQDGQDGNHENISSNSRMQQQNHSQTTQPQSQKHPQPQQQSANPQINISKPSVNLFTVWTLPGVALPVLALSSVKAINAIIVSWLVFYFNKLDMVKQSRIFAIAWTCSIVIGGFIGAKINHKLSYKIFILCLFISGFVFFLLEELHMHPNEFEVIGLVVICAILVGGPYNQLTTAVPLKLCEDPQIRQRPQAKSAIISLMQGFSIFICSISVLIVPSIGISRLHYMASALCFISVMFLCAEQLRIWLKRRKMVEENSQNRSNGKRNCGGVELKEEM